MNFTHTHTYTHTYSPRTHARCICICIQNSVYINTYPASHKAKKPSSIRGQRKSCYLSNGLPPRGRPDQEGHLGPAFWTYIIGDWLMVGSLASCWRGSGRGEVLSCLSFPLMYFLFFRGGSYANARTDTLADARIFALYVVMCIHCASHRIAWLATLRRFMFYKWVITQAISRRWFYKFCIWM